MMIALFAALTTVGAYISVPLGPTPFTLQVLFVLLAGMLLGPRNGALAIAVYVLMGLVGMPVFANGMAGIGIVFKPTFGYLLGFILASFVTGLIVEKTNHAIFYFVGPLVGLAVIYLIGVPYLYYIFNTVIYPDMPIDVMLALQYGLFPFVAFDLVKVGLAGFIGMSVVPALKRI